MDEKEKNIRKRIYELKDREVSFDELKEIDIEIGKLLRVGYLPLLVKNNSTQVNDELQSELEEKFDEIFKELGGNEFKETDIILDFMNLCQNSEYEFYKSKTFINFLKLSPVNSYPYVREYKIKENLRKYLKYINDNYLIVNAGSIVGLINAMRLSRLVYAKEVSDLFDEYVEEFDDSKIQTYIKNKKTLNKDEFWDFAQEINKYKISDGMLSKEVCEYIICESLNPKSQISLYSDFWTGLKDCAFCDYLTYEQIESCDEWYYLNYTSLLDIARGEYSSWEATICLNPYYIYKFCAEDISALTTLFHELEHLKQNKAKRENKFLNLHYDMLKENIMDKEMFDVRDSRELLLFSEMEARRLGFENAINFLKQKNINLKKLKSRAIVSSKKLSIDEFVKSLYYDYRNCMFEKFYGRRRFSTNKRLKKIFENSPEKLVKNQILFYEFNEDGTLKSLEEILKKIDLDLANKTLDKETAKAILKSTLFDSVNVTVKDYKKRIESFLTFDYSCEKTEKFCKDVLDERIKEILGVLSAPRKLKNKVEICSLLKTYLK